MRKKAQEKKLTMLLATSSSNSCSSASNDPKLDTLPSKDSREESFYDTGGPETSAAMEIKNKGGENKTDNAMDDIWQEISLSDQNPITPANECYSEEGSNFFSPQLFSPAWEYSTDSLWKVHNKEHKMRPPIRDLPFSDYEDVEYFSG